MGPSACRKMVSCVLLFLLPGSLFAADTEVAMLYTNGPAWVNGAHVPRASSAIFTGDLVQTRSDSVANINQTGSSITVLSDSMVRFQGNAVGVEHGGVTVSTSKQIAAVAGDVKVAPASPSWTEFNVVDTDGNVKIAARKGDLLITDGDETFTLQQGQETTRDDSSSQTTDSKDGKKKSKKGTNAAPAGGSGAILDSPYAIAGAGAAAIGITTWILLKNENPASPATP
jgi:hypothetical protein